MSPTHSPASPAPAVVCDDAPGGSEPRRPQGSSSSTTRRKSKKNDSPAHESKASNGMPAPLGGGGALDLSPEGAFSRSPSPVGPAREPAERSVKSAKRARDDDDDANTAESSASHASSSPPKRAKVSKVQFHPGTLDNWRWAERGLEKGSRTPTPAPIVPETPAVVWPTHLAPATSGARQETRFSTHAQFDPGSPPPELDEVSVPKGSPPPALRRKSLPVALREDDGCESDDERTDDRRSAETVRGFPHPHPRGRFTRPPPPCKAKSLLLDGSASHGPQPAVPSAAEVEEFSRILSESLDESMEYALSQIMVWNTHKAWEAGFAAGIRTQLSQHALAAAKATAIESKGGVKVSAAKPRKVLRPSYAMYDYEEYDLRSPDTKWVKGPEIDDE